MNFPPLLNESCIQQSRSADKRPHNPTNRLGVNVAIKDQHVLYATENRSLKDNRRLLMVPGMRSKKVLSADVPAVSVFPVNVLLGSKPATSLDVVLPQSNHPISSLVPVWHQLRVGAELSLRY